MQQLWSYLWFRFTAVTALGKSSSKISPNSDKELPRKSRLCYLFFFHAFLLLIGPACTFLSGASALSISLALSRPWGIPYTKGSLALGVSPGLGERRDAQAEILSPRTVTPEPFGSLKSSASHGGRNWEEPEGENDVPCARNSSRWAAGCKTKP